MGLFAIALGNAKQRGLSTILTAISLALGIGLVVAVLSINGVVKDAFERNKNVGYNMVVGAKGSGLQLTLNTVFYLSQPIENLPYEYYLEFFDQAERERQLQTRGGRLAEPDRDGRFAQNMAGGLVIPVCLGDYYEHFRVVGTTPDFFNELRFGAQNDLTYDFAEGRNFKTHTEENGFFEAVIGSRVAAETGIAMGDLVDLTHGDPDSENALVHDLGFKVVGILKPTGTPNDRAAFVNMEGFYLLEGHSLGKREPSEDAENEGSVVDPVVIEKDAKGYSPLPLEQREVTAILLKSADTSIVGALMLQNFINEGEQAQAAAPVGEIAKLMENFVAPMNMVLSVIVVLTCIVSGIGIMVGIYNSMNDRRRDIGVMRALGAQRGTVMTVILLESGIISLLGGVFGWVMAHAGLAFFSSSIEEYTGVPVHFFSVTSYEVFVIPCVLILAIASGFLPAMVAYRTDVSRALAS